MKTSMDNDKFIIPNSAGSKWLNIKLDETQNDNPARMSKSCNVDHPYDEEVVLDVEGIHWQNQMKSDKVEDIPTIEDTLHRHTEDRLSWNNAILIDDEIR
jgi:hypothetical protein